MAECSQRSCSSTSGGDLLHVGVDDFYFAVLSVSEEEAELFPISDEKYAEQLWFQEALMSSVLIKANCSHHNHQRVSVDIGGSSSSKNEDNNNSTDTFGNSKKKMKAAVDMNHIEEDGAGEFPQSLSLCKICFVGKPIDEMFMMRNISKCSHTFCTVCISKHIAAKIQENIMMVTCPEPNCREPLEPHMCRAIIPEQVFDRWENALCESLILGSQKIYCPFEDCSAMLVNDGEEVIRETECPHCCRLFCAQCQVPWHSEIGCDEFQILKKDGTGDLLLMNLANQKKWRRCSKCKFYVEKKDGCLHINCRCGYEFCYACGARWSQTHGSCVGGV